MGTVGKLPKTSCTAKVEKKTIMLSKSTVKLHKIKVKIFLHKHKTEKIKFELKKIAQPLFPPSLKILIK